MPPGRWPPLRFTITIWCGLGLAGCQTSREQLDLPPNARGIIIANKALLWRDLESIKNASITAPQRQAGVWRVCVRLDTKGSFGAYTGERDYVVALYGVAKPPELLMEDAALTCAAQPHVLFPELEGSYMQKDEGKSKPGKPEK
jgi:hypothetical protein